MSVVPSTQQQPAVRNPAQELVARVRTEVFRDQVKLALPEGVSADRFTRVAITALQQNPDIVECDVDTIFSSLLRAAADGLLPDGREAALVSFNTKDKTTDRWVKKAQYMPMIGGLRKIAAEHGWILRTDVIYANDHFEHALGEKPWLEHRPARLDQERGDIIGAYAVATHRDGRRQIEVLRKDDIEKVRQVSKSKDRGPWADWYDRMAEKTAGRRLFAKLPLGERESDRVVRVLEASELEPGEAAHMLYGPNADHSFRAREIEAAPPDEAGHQQVAAIAAAPGIEGSGAEAAPADGHPQPEAADSQREAAPVASETPAGEETPTPAAAAPSSAADDDGEPPLFDDDLGALVVPRGTREGMTLAAIESGRKPEEWAAWSLDRAAEYWPADFKPQVEEWVRTRFPAVWAKHETKQAA